MERNLAGMLEAYAIYLHSEERSANTIAKYVRDLRAFLKYLGGEPLGKEAVLGWKERLMATHAPAS